MDRGEEKSGRGTKAWRVAKRATATRMVMIWDLKLRQKDIMCCEMVCIAAQCGLKTWLIYKERGIKQRRIVPIN